MPRQDSAPVAAAGVSAEMQQLLEMQQRMEETIRKYEEMKRSLETRMDQAGALQGGVRARERSPEIQPLRQVLAPIQEELPDLSVRSNPERRLILPLAPPPELLEYQEEEDGELTDDLSGDEDPDPSGA